MHNSSKLVASNYSVRITPVALDKPLCVIVTIVVSVVTPCCVSPNVDGSFGAGLHALPNGERVIPKLLLVTWRIGQMISAQQAAKKWLERAQASGNAIRESVSAMTEAENPMEKAAQAADQWLAGVQQAAANGSFQKGLRKVTLAQWKDAMIKKGIVNYGNGLAMGQNKMLAFQQVFLPYVQQVKASLPPRGTLAQNIARSVAMQQGLAQFSMNDRS